MNGLRKPFALLLVLALTATVFADGRHPNHISLAEVEYNAKTGELEVALALLAIDFEESLSRRAGKRVNLDTTKGIKKMIEAYLAERFVITLPNGLKPKPSFLGREDKGKVVWLYFTLPFNLKKAAAGGVKKKQPAPSGEKKATVKKTPKPHSSTHSKVNETTSALMGATLQNRVLMELNDVQYNRVILREGKWKRHMMFERHNQSQVLRKNTAPEQKSSKPTSDKTAKKKK